jgi:hypothetical protein
MIQEELRNMCVWNTTVLVLNFFVYLYTGERILLETLHFQAFHREIQMKI